MKLIVCLECSDIVKLRKVWRTCHCGRSRGVYKNEKDATVSGPCVPLGILNRSFRTAIVNRPDEGLGVRFDAFVIPKLCPTIEVLK